MHIAIEGCCHGELDAIYGSLARAEHERGTKVELLLVCGDFQALRNEHDYESLAVPAKFRQLGSFHRYYTGEKVAPVLTIVIGGNHEASNYMWELYHGGWLAPNIYYLGTAGSVLVNGLRITGASGIYKPHDYHKGFFETLPYDRSTLRSCYHIRHHTVTKLMLLPPSHLSSSSSSSVAPPPAADAPSPFPPSPHPSIFLSHDWPLSIAPKGDLPQLLRRKPFFASEIESDTLGSPPLRDLLQVLRPAWWFAAHLHVKFAAVWKHGEPGGGQRRGQQQQQQQAGRGRQQLEQVGASGLPPKPFGAPAVKNPDEIDLDDDDDDDGLSASAPPAATAANPDEISLSDDDDAPPAAAAAAEEAVDQTADKVEAAETRDLAQQPAASPASVVGGGNPDEIMLDADAEEAEEEDDELDEEPKGHRHVPGLPLGAGLSAGLPAKPSSTAAAAVDDRPTPSGPGGSRPGEADDGGVTRFLALDKCMPTKDFLQILDIPFPLASPSSSSDGGAGTRPSLTYDPHWLAITRALHPFLSLTPQPLRLPSMPELKARVAQEMAWIEKEGMGLDERGEGRVKVDEVQTFWKTAPGPGEPGGGPANWYTNPQTIAFCAMLQIPNRINPFPAGFKPPALPFKSRFAPSVPAATAAVEGGEVGGAKLGRGGGAEAADGGLVAGVEPVAAAPAPVQQTAADDSAAS